MNTARANKEHKKGKVRRDKFVRVKRQLSGGHSEYLKPDLDLNPEFLRAFEMMENTQKNVFVTGKAGSGKSTLLTYFRNKTKKKIIVLAPTGVAALNVRGQTIHSFFGFKPSITLSGVKKLTGSSQDKKIYKEIDAIVIDEISMVRSDLLDCVDRFMRLNGRDDKLSFGGAQMIFIGDLYQLPPVVSSGEREIFQSVYKSQYFFDAKVFNNFPMEFIELEKIYRQKDQDFIDLLNVVRNNSAEEEHLAAFNKRYDPEFMPHPEDFFIYLTTTNALADEINKRQLAQLKTKPHSYHGDIQGDFEQRALPTDVDLEVKEGAQVMMLNNDMAGRWVNGSIGKVVSIKKNNDEDDDEVIAVQLSDGKKVFVSQFTWEISRFSYNEESKSLTSETVGTFTQYPLSLAWAVTIHKSQGKTFDKVVVDVGKGTFAHGQMYVALSRCTTLEGLVLRKLMLKRHILMDWRVVRFVTQCQYNISDNILPLEQKIEMIERTIVEKSRLEIVYLKANDEKSKRVVKPLRVGEMEYAGKKFIGMSALDSKRQEERTFRVDRILEIKQSKV